MAEKQQKTPNVFDTPENKERLTRFEQMAAQDEANRTKASKIFNPTKLMQRANQIHEFNHPTLGTIRLGELTLQDTNFLQECKTDTEKTAMVLYLMLKKAYPTMPNYTPENINEFFNAFPLIEGAALLKLASKQPAFLPQTSTNGSKAASKRKKSG